MVKANMLVSGFAKLVFIFTTVSSKALNDFEKEEMDWRSESDKIQSLPTLETFPEFNMYSGYLELSPSKALFYWFNECEDPSTTKLIIWFNGGPGCSSLDGLFIEHGPFKFEDFSGRLIKNPYSWNRLAHTLYIESPVGVGFSYNNEETEMDDDIAAQENLEVLEEFFTKFPSYQGYDIYITGESYGGIYIPVLVNAMIEANSSMIHNIKGIAIGNGLLNVALNANSLVYYAYYHGLFGTHMWNELQRYCCNEDECKFNSFDNEDCMIKVAQVRHAVANDNLNIYDLYGECASESEVALSKHYSRQYFQLQSGSVVTMNKNIVTEGLSLIPPCSNVSIITDYLNREDVQTAIHARPRVWEICSDQIFNNYERQYVDMSRNIRHILQSLDDIRIILYFGDFDMACNFMGGEWFVDQLGYEILTPRRKWFVEENGSRQVAGFFKEYDRLAYVTVKGAGHMSPVNKPLQVFEMLKRYLDDDPL